MKKSTPIVKPHDHENLAKILPHKKIIDELDFYLNII